MRYLGDPSAPMTPPSPEGMAEMGAFAEEATKAGVLLATGGVAPLNEAVKVQYHDGEFTVLDAYLAPEPTIAQRIVRAKKTLATAKVPFGTPDSQQRPSRLSSVLEVIYLIFNEGYSATAGDHWMRRPGRPGPRRAARRRGRSLHPAGRHRRLPRPRVPGWPACAATC